MKVCTHCNQSLPLTSFAKQATGKDGLRADCKDCHKAYGYYPEGVTKSMYANQKAKSRRRSHPQPNYSWEQLHSWVTSQPNWQSIYDNWVQSGYLTDLKPSGDRIDDYKPYCLTNLQLTTVKQNIDRSLEDRKNGINNKSNRAVSQYTLDGVFVNKHHSVSEAARMVGTSPSNIRMAAENAEVRRKNSDGTYRTETRTKCKGYIWKFEE